MPTPRCRLSGLRTPGSCAQLEQRLQRGAATLRAEPGGAGGHLAWRRASCACRLSIAVGRGVARRPAASSSRLCREEPCAGRLGLCSAGGPGTSPQGQGAECQLRPQTSVAASRAAVSLGPRDGNVSRKRPRPRGPQGAAAAPGAVGGAGLRAPATPHTGFFPTPGARAAEDGRRALPGPQTHSVPRDADRRAARAPVGPTESASGPQVCHRVPVRCRLVPPGSGWCQGACEGGGASPHHVIAWGKRSRESSAGRTDVRLTGPCGRDAGWRNGGMGSGRVSPRSGREACAWPTPPSHALACCASPHCPPISVITDQ